MKKLRAWLEARGFSLELRNCAESAVDVGCDKLVTVDARLSPPARVSTLLHECGHVCIFLHRRRWPRVRVAGATWNESWKNRGRCGPRARVGRLAELQEELEAWDRGEALARRLRLRIPRRVYERVRLRCLMTYARWAGECMRVRRQRSKRA